MSNNQYRFRYCVSVCIAVVVSLLSYPLCPQCHISVRHATKKCRVVLLCPVISRLLFQYCLSYKRSTLNLNAMQPNVLLFALGSMSTQGTWDRVRWTPLPSLPIYFEARVKVPCVWDRNPPGISFYPSWLSTKNAHVDVWWSFFMYS
jgi:hypothetical protein